ncbi:transposase [Streptomyces spectabilis]|uniref:transposase n=1 Tax=Streptomyces spectabilis TaxID=68270 RepID=UPI0033E6E9D3
MEPGDAGPGPPAQDWLALERLPAYAPELNPVELLWSSLKKRELPNLAGDRPADAADATEHRIRRIDTSSHLPGPALRGMWECGKCLWHVLCINVLRAPLLRGLPC